MSNLQKEHISKTNNLEHEKRIKISENSVKWEEFREKRNEAIILYVKTKQRCIGMDLILRQVM